MQFPEFEHAAFLDRVWHDAPPAHNIGGSSFLGGSWQERGLPEWPVDLDPGQVNLKAPQALRSAIATHVGQREDHVMATAGTTGANLAVTLWAHQPGGNVVVEAPIYSPLEATAAGVGAEVRRVPRNPDDAWRLNPDDVAETVDNNTNLIVLASPNNPTQAAASKADLLALAEIAQDVDAHVLVDQVYRELTDDVFAAPLHPRLISTAGFNKSWGLPTMRIGWLTAIPELVAQLQNVHMQTIMSPSAAMEAMAAQVLPLAKQCRAQLQDCLAANHRVYQAWVNKTSGVEDPNPRHLTAFPKLPVDDTAAFCERIAGDPGVALVPGEYFGWPGHARIGLGGDPAKLEAGLDALAACLP